MSWPQGQVYRSKFSFLSGGIILWMELLWPENPALQSVVAGSISGFHSWWDLIRSKQLSSILVNHAQVFAGLSGHGYSVHNIIPLHKKENVDQYTFMQL